MSSSAHFGPALSAFGWSREERPWRFAANSEALIRAVEKLPSHPSAGASCIIEISLGPDDARPSSYLAPRRRRRPGPPFGVTKRAALARVMQTR